MLRADRDRLFLQIERALVTRARLRMVLASADAALAGHRRELRAVKARIKRGRGRNPRLSGRQGRVE